MRASELEGEGRGERGRKSGGRVTRVPFSRRDRKQPVGVGIDSSSWCMHDGRLGDGTRATNGGGHGSCLGSCKSWAAWAWFLQKLHVVTMGRQGRSTGTFTSFSRHDRKQPGGAGIDSSRWCMHDGRLGDWEIGRWHQSNQRGRALEAA